MTLPKIITFGELMLRLSPPGFERLLQSPMLVATFGGGEANVAVGLANLGGVESVYITALPKNAIGDAAVPRAGDCAFRAPRHRGLPRAWRRRSRGAPAGHLGAGAARWTPLPT
jgi:hypothetical protein